MKDYIKSITKDDIVTSCILLVAFAIIVHILG